MRMNTNMMTNKKNESDNLTVLFEELLSKELTYEMAINGDVDSKSKILSYLLKIQDIAKKEPNILRFEFNKKVSGKNYLSIFRSILDKEEEIFYDGVIGHVIIGKDVSSFLKEKITS